MSYSGTKSDSLLFILASIRPAKILLQTSGPRFHARVPREMHHTHRLEVSAHLGPLGQQMTIPVTIGHPKIIKSPRAKSKLGETRRNMMTWRNHPKPLKHFETLFGLGVSNRGMNAMFIKFHHSCGVDMEATWET